MIIGVVVFCDDCRPADVDAYHAELLTGPWPPPVLAETWECPHLRHHLGSAAR